MRDVPTDLLRAFVAIIDLKGFARAGDQLGRTQSAISLRMKRLQEILEVPLFARDEGAAQLTEPGEIVANYARQILALNDEMLVRLARRESGGRLRVGMPHDYADHFLPTLMRDMETQDDIAFDVVCALSCELLQGLRDDLYDIVVAMTPDGPAPDPFMTWRDRLAWVGCEGPARNNPLRLVCYPEGCLYRRAMLTALQRDGRPFSVVYASPSLNGIEAAVSTGFGVTVMSERVSRPALAPIADQAGLPKLPDVVVGVYINPHLRTGFAKSFAARIADIVMKGHQQVMTGHEQR
jgi:DNA-binding transcriptional LysR family regulator